MYENTREELARERRLREALEAKVAKLEATVEYLAMMVDVDIDRDERGDKNG